MFSGIANIGDMAVVIEGWSPHWLWRILMTVLGTGMFMGSIYIANMEMGKLIGGDIEKDQVSRFVRLGIFFYIGAILVVVGAAFMNSEGIGALPAIAGIIAVVGALSPFAWMPQWFQAKMFTKHASSVPLSIDRDWGLIAAGLIAAIIYIFVLGPGIMF